jgi:hypothetical protein
VTIFGESEANAHTHLALARNNMHEKKHYIYKRTNQIINSTKIIPFTIYLPFIENLSESKSWKSIITLDTLC